MPTSLPRLTTFQKIVVEELIDSIDPRKDTTQELLYIAHYLAFSEPIVTYVLDKADYYAISRYLLRERLRVTPIPHTAIFRIWAFGLGHGTLIKDINEITFPATCAKWTEFISTFETHRLSYFRGQNKDSKAKKYKVPRILTLTQMGKTLKEVELLSRETRATVASLETLVKSCMFIPSPADVTEEGEFSLLHSYKEVRRELYEAHKKIAILEGIQDGKIQQKLDMVKILTDDSIGKFSRNLSEMMSIKDILHKITNDDEDSSDAVGFTE